LVEMISYSVIEILGFSSSRADLHDIEMCVCL